MYNSQEIDRMAKQLVEETESYLAMVAKMRQHEWIRRVSRHLLFGLVSLGQVCNPMVRDPHNYEDEK